MYPQYCTMYIAGIEDTYFAEQRLGYWNNVYGRGPSKTPNYAVAGTYVNRPKRYNAALQA